MPGDLAARLLVRRLAHGEHHWHRRIGITRDHGEAAHALAGDILLDAVFALLHPLVEHRDGPPLLAEDEYVDAIGVVILAKAFEHGVDRGVGVLGTEHDAQTVQRYIFIFLGHQSRRLERLGNEFVWLRAAQLHVIPAIFLRTEQHRVGRLALMRGAETFRRLPHALERGFFRGNADRPGHKAQEFQRFYAAHGNARE